MPEIPELATYLLISSVTGLVAVVRTRFKRSGGKTVKQTLNCFAGWFCVGFVFSLNIYAAAIYTLPGEVISYESAYEITYPGPPIGKMGHCEAGLWIKDAGTHRRIALCTNKAKLDEDIKQGMTAVWVNAHTNKLGSYIMSYTFIYK
ncbi:MULTISPECIES: hypothetical protein [Pseudomonas]|uniref:Uncharacterized protein n=1 Tax=Pseudomonas aphyarum TaxID=2942629 RepID=A0ABT5PH65_9PSED|nr:hypothetical protein [Pseudomonas aphyarum]MDD0967794.1 hypothetical protein [Pseudomonas aphyarum]MDD1123105.1 hypothetical protein [Pseudomonas aphyarum]